ncbi:LOW QUALITY PROTEIN: hypothetical protein ACHAW5_003880 [Stephanodiscus triporus]|uniref:ABC transmembrane type-1 domain-containing protein n=1 Tax=Stephanodiscus triporus TaxID=2934178 RepID=A0ABD3MSZ3_9STRA
MSIEAVLHNRVDNGSVSKTGNDDMETLLPRRNNALLMKIKMTITRLMLMKSRYRRDVSSTLGGSAGSFSHHSDPTDLPSAVCTERQRQVLKGCGIWSILNETTALLSPTIVLPLGILVLIILSLVAAQYLEEGTSRMIFGALLISSTAAQAIVHSMQFNAQMTFFANTCRSCHRGQLQDVAQHIRQLGWDVNTQFLPDCKLGDDGVEICTGGKDAYFPLQMILSALGCFWIFVMGKRVQHVAELPDDAWRTHIGEAENNEKETRNS